MRSEDYIQGYFKAAPQIAVRLTDMLKAHPRIWLSVQDPANLRLFCKIVDRAYKSSPETVDTLFAQFQTLTGAFKQIEQSLFEIQYFQRNSVSLLEDESFDTLPEPTGDRTPFFNKHYHNERQFLMKLAFDNIANQKTTFTYSSVASLLKELGIENSLSFIQNLCSLDIINILPNENLLVEESTYQFTTSDLQQYFAAVYIYEAWQSPNLALKNKINDFIVSEIFNPNWHATWGFVAGLSRDNESLTQKLFALMSADFNSEHVRVSHYHLGLLVYCFDEAMLTKNTNLRKKATKLIQQKIALLFDLNDRDALLEKFSSPLLEQLRLSPSWLEQRDANDLFAMISFSYYEHLSKKELTQLAKFSLTANNFDVDIKNKKVKKINKIFWFLHQLQLGTPKVLEYLGEQIRTPKKVVASNNTVTNTAQLAAKPRSSQTLEKVEKAINDTLDGTNDCLNYIRQNYPDDMTTISESISHKLAKNLEVGKLSQLKVACEIIKALGVRAATLPVLNAMNEILKKLRTPINLNVELKKEIIYGIDQILSQFREILESVQCPRDVTNLLKTITNYSTDSIVDGFIEGLRKILKEEMPELNWDTEEGDYSIKRWAWDCIGGLCIQKLMFVDIDEELMKIKFIIFACNLAEGLEFESAILEDFKSKFAMIAKYNDLNSMAMKFIIFIYAFDGRLKIQKNENLEIKNKVIGETYQMLAQFRELLKYTKNSTDAVKFLQKIIGCSTDVVADSFIKGLRRILKKDIPESDRHTDVLDKFIEGLQKTSKKDISTLDWDTEEANCYIYKWAFDCIHSINQQLYRGEMSTSNLCVDPEHLFPESSLELEIHRVPEIDIKDSTQLKFIMYVCNLGAGLNFEFKFESKFKELANAREEFLFDHFARWRGLSPQIQDLSEFFAKIIQKMERKFSFANPYAWGYLENVLRALISLRNEQLIMRNAVNFLGHSDYSVRKLALDAIKICRPEAVTTEMTAGLIEMMMSDEAGSSRQTIIEALVHFQIKTNEFFYCLLELLKQQEQLEELNSNNAAITNMLFIALRQFGPVATNSPILQVLKNLLKNRYKLPSTTLTIIITTLGYLGAAVLDDPAILEFLLNNIREFGDEFFDETIATIDRLGGAAIRIDVLEALVFSISNKEKNKRDKEIDLIGKNFSGFVSCCLKNSNENSLTLLNDILMLADLHMNLFWCIQKNPTEKIFHLIVYSGVNKTIINLSANAVEILAKADLPVVYLDKDVEPVTEADLPLEHWGKYVEPVTEAKDYVSEVGSDFDAEARLGRENAAMSYDQIVAIYARRSRETGIMMFPPSPEDAAKIEVMSDYDHEREYDNFVPLASKTRKITQVSSGNGKNESTPICYVRKPNILKQPSNVPENVSQVSSGNEKEELPAIIDDRKMSILDKRMKEGGRMLDPESPVTAGVLEAMSSEFDHERVVTSDIENTDLNIKTTKDSELVGELQLAIDNIAYIISMMQLESIDISSEKRLKQWILKELETNPEIGIDPTALKAIENFPDAITVDPALFISFLQDVLEIMPLVRNQIKKILFEELLLQKDKIEINDDEQCSIKEEIEELRSKTRSSKINTPQQSFNLDFIAKHQADNDRLLLQIVDNNMQCLPVCFENIWGATNFKSQLESLIILGNLLKKPAFFLGDDCCGFIVENNLLFVHPQGVDQNHDSLKILREMQKDKILNKVWLSIAIMQKPTDKKDLAVICLELALHVLGQFTLEKFNQFLKNLDVSKQQKNSQPQRKNKHHKKSKSQKSTEFHYPKISLEALLPQSLLELAKKSEHECIEQLQIISRQHRILLQTLVYRYATLVNLSSDDYLDRCKNSAALILFGKLINGEITADKISQSNEFGMLKEVLAEPERQRLIKERALAHKEMKANETRSSNPDTGEEPPIVFPHPFLGGVFGASNVQKNEADLQELDHKVLLPGGEKVRDGKTEVTPTLKLT